MAIKLGEQHPQIVTAVSELKTAYTETGQKYIKLATFLRQAKLLKKEGTLLLLGLGLTKGRASELLTLSAVGDEVWEKYTLNQVGFRAALQLDKPQVPTGEQTTIPEVEKPKKETVKIYDVPNEVKTALREVPMHFKRPLKGGKKTEYAYAHTFEGVNYYFAITASAKA